MLLIGVNFYDEDINFQSSDRPQFLTHTKCQRVQAEAPVFTGKGVAIAMTTAATLCYIQYSWAISTVVAHFLHTEGVTGSSPVSPI